MENESSPAPTGPTDDDLPGLGTHGVGVLQTDPPHLRDRGFDVKATIEGDPALPLPPDATYTIVLAGATLRKALVGAALTGVFPEEFIGETLKEKGDYLVREHITKAMESLD